MFWSVWIFSIANGDARSLWEAVHPGSIKSPERRFEPDCLRSCSCCTKFVHADPDSHMRYTRSTNASRTQTMRSSCTIGHWHSSRIRRCACTDGPSCCTHRGNIRCVCSAFCLLAPFHVPFPLSPHRHLSSIDACMKNAADGNSVGL